MHTILGRDARLSRVRLWTLNTIIEAVLREQRWDNDLVPSVDVVGIGDGATIRIEMIITVWTDDSGTIASDTLMRHDEGVAKAILACEDYLIATDSVQVERATARVQRAFGGSPS